MSTQAPEIKKIASPAATLRSMRKGNTMMVPTAEIKTASLRSAAARLKKDGYGFNITETGLINETLVVCYKSPK